MEQAKEKVLSVNLFTQYDLLKAMHLKVGDEISFLDCHFRIVELNSNKSNYEIKLLLLNDENKNTQIFLNLTSLINIPFIKI